MKNLFSLLFLLLAASCISAQNIVLQGYVRHHSSHTQLPFAEIHFQSSETYTTQSDITGHYSITLPVNTYIVEINYPGYETFHKNFSCSTLDTQALDFDLQPVLRGKTDTQQSIMSDEIPVAVPDTYTMPTVKSVAVLSEVMVVESTSKKPRTKTKTKTESTKAIPSSESISFEISESATGAVTTDGYDPAPSPAAQSGLLSCGSIHDFSKWNLWNDKKQEELTLFKDRWQLYPHTRYSVQVLNPDKNAIAGAKVSLMSHGKVLWQAMTDNSGRAELWLNYFLKDDQNKTQNLKIVVEKNGQKQTLSKPTTFEEHINTIELALPCEEVQLVELSFVVDATGSMGDEIEFLKSDLYDVLTRLQDSLPLAKFKFSSVFYKDQSDHDYITTLASTDKINKMIDFIQAQYAGGGGDFPEAVEEGLDAAINQVEWSSESSTKLLFLILDAPPHEAAENHLLLQKTIINAAQKGIQIIPIACSGIDKSTEYLLRSIALATNGNYLFLTDKSGIGNSHIAPTTDKYDENTLNHLLLQTILNYCYQAPCTIDPQVSSIADTSTAQLLTVIDTTQDSTAIDSQRVSPPSSISWKYYPNPTTGIVYVQSEQLSGELYVTDITGKVLSKYTIAGDGSVVLDLSPLANGMYLIRYEYEPEKFLTGRVMLVR